MKLDAIAKQVQSCQKCDLRIECTQPVPGLGVESAQYFIMGKYPGREEDATGLPEVGMAGRRLNKLLELAKIDINDCFITNVVKCKPPTVDHKIRTPTKKEIKTCLPWLLAELEAVRFSQIITLGDIPLSLFSDEGIRTLHGTMLLDAEILPRWLK